MSSNDVGFPLASTDLAAASKLQGLLPGLLSLSLNAKQAHWNVVGPAFVPLHQLTDELAKDALTWADLIAERAMALGYSVDARPRTVAAESDDLPAGRLRDDHVVSSLIGLTARVARNARHAVRDLDQEPVGQDLAIQVLHGLERYQWMFRAQLAAGFDPTTPETSWSTSALPTAG